MFCYIDESGNTGSNIFDTTQPVQYYGLLISPVNLNTQIFHQVEEMRNKLNVTHLHARGLGERLELISEDLIELMDNLSLTFYVVTLNKHDNVIFQFFDLVFDNEINPEVPIRWYCSPFRYKLLIAISYFIFNEEILVLAWKSFTEKKEGLAIAAFIETCKKLRNKLHKLPFPPDIRCKVFLILKWAIEHHDQIPFQFGNKVSSHVSIVCFGSVIDCIRKTRVQPKEIIIDQESTYNVPQQDILNLYRELKHYPFPKYPNMPFVKLDNIPEIDFSFSSSKVNLGLEITDIYLWICKRVIEGRQLNITLKNMVNSPKFLWANDISLRALTKRWLLKPAS